VDDLLAVPLASFYCDVSFLIHEMKLKYQSRWHEATWGGGSRRRRRRDGDLEKSIIKCSKTLSLG